MGIDTLELNRRAEQEQWIDDFIDGQIRDLESSAGVAVIESRMAFHFLKSAWHIFLYCSEEIAAHRILTSKRDTETYQSLTEAIDSVAKRRAIEIRRFLKLYQVDISDLTNYDFILDTSYSTLQATIDCVYSLISRSQKPSKLIAISPRNLIPTQNARHLREADCTEYARFFMGIRSDVVSLDDPVEIIYLDHRFYIANGHHRVSGALLSGKTWVACKIIAVNDQPYLLGLSARAFVRDAATMSTVYDWEAIHRTKVPFPNTTGDAKS